MEEEKEEKEERALKVCVCGEKFSRHPCTLHMKPQSILYPLILPHMHTHTPSHMPTHTQVTIPTATVGCGWRMNRNHVLGPSLVRLVLVSFPIHPGMRHLVLIISFPVLRLELMVLEILSSLSYSKQFMRTRPDLFTVSVEGARAMAQMINIKLGTDDAENSQERWGTCLQ